MNQRKTLLINKKFQLFFASYVTFWLMPLTLIYPFIIYRLFNLFVEYNFPDTTYPTAIAIGQTKIQIIWLIVILEVLFLLLSFLFSIFISHKIAGPLFKLHKNIEQVSKGNFDSEVVFRKGDQFVELSKAFNEMLKIFRASLTTHADMARKATAQIEKSIPFVSHDTQVELKKTLSYLHEIKPPSHV